MLDEKFNDMAIRQFESARAGIHEYWVIAEKLNYTKSLLARRCELPVLITQLMRPDVVGVIFHSLPGGWYKILRLIPDAKCVVWIGWGYDYYSLLRHENEESRILPKTKFIRQRSFDISASRILSGVLAKVRLVRNRAQLSLLKRVDYFSPVLDIEYEMVLRHVPLRAKYIVWNYGTAEDDLTLPDMGFSSGRNILAGNSASAANNHLELFEAIRDQVDLSGRKVVTPLSYGDPYYRDKVIEKGELLLGDAFMPLTNFLQREQYIKTIRSCGFVVMNHLRQQALGNICMAMLMGAKVYLNNGNPLVKWLSARGAVVGSVDRLDMMPLEKDKMVINRSVILSHWGRDIQIQKTSKLIDAILCEGIIE